VIFIFNMIFWFESRTQTVLNFFTSHWGANKILKDYHWIVVLSFTLFDKTYKEFFMRLFNYQKDDIMHSYYRGKELMLIYGGIHALVIFSLFHLFRKWRKKSQEDQKAKEKMEENGERRRKQSKENSRSRTQSFKSEKSFLSNDSEFKKECPFRVRNKKKETRKSISQILPIVKYFDDTFEEKNCNGSPKSESGSLENEKDRICKKCRGKFDKKERKNSKHVTFEEKECSIDPDYLNLSFDPSVNGSEEKMSFKQNQENGEDQKKNNGKANNEFSEQDTSSYRKRERNNHKEGDNQSEKSEQAVDLTHLIKSSYRDLLARSLRFKTLVKGKMEECWEYIKENQDSLLDFCFNKVIIPVVHSYRIYFFFLKHYYKKHLEETGHFKVLLSPNQSNYLSVYAESIFNIVKHILLCAFFNNVVGFLSRLMIYYNEKKKRKALRTYYWGKIYRMAIVYFMFYCIYTQPIINHFLHLKGLPFYHSSYEKLKDITFLGLIFTTFYI